MFKGRIPSICLNEVRDLTAELLTEVCHDVEVEPHLQPLNDETFHYKTTNVQDGAHLDISMNGFWDGRFEKLSGSSIRLLLPTVDPTFILFTGNLNLQRGLINQDSETVLLPH